MCFKRCSHFHFHSNLQCASFAISFLALGIISVLNNMNNKLLLVHLCFYGCWWLWTSFPTFASDLGVYWHDSPLPVLWSFFNWLADPPHINLTSFRVRQILQLSLPTITIWPTCICFSVTQHIVGTICSALTIFWSLYFSALLFWRYFDLRIFSLPRHLVNSMTLHSGHRWPAPRDKNGA